MARLLLFCMMLWGARALGLEQYTVETLSCDVLAPEGSKNARLFWEGEVRNNTAQDVTLVPSVVLRDEASNVLGELRVPEVTVGRLGKAHCKELLLVDAELWRKTRSIEGKFALSGRSAKKGEPEVELYCVSDFDGCRKARDFLRRNRISFAEYDLTRDAAAVRRLQKEHKLAVQWPTLIVNGNAIVGYFEGKYREAFGIDE